MELPIIGPIDVEQPVADRSAPFVIDEMLKCLDSVHLDHATNIGNYFSS
jgi:hypothetical protein